MDSRKTWEEMELSRPDLSVVEEAEGLIKHEQLGG